MKGKTPKFILTKMPFQSLTVKKSMSAMDMPSDGMTPVVRFSLWTMMENTAPYMAPSTTDRVCTQNQRQMLLKGICVDRSCDVKEIAEHRYTVQRRLDMNKAGIMHSRRVRAKLSHGDLTAP